MSGLHKALSGCAITVGVVIAAFVGVILWEFHGLGAGPQPDVAKAAQSATAVRADQAVTAQVDSRIAQLRAATPWATYLGTAVADVCDTELKPTGEDLMAQQSWLPVNCTRTDTVYEAFDGDFRQRLAQFDGALGAAGWRPQDFGMSEQKVEPPGLVSALDHVHEPPGDPQPSDVAAAAARPNVVDVSYTVPITPDFTPPAAWPMSKQLNGEVEAAQNPHLPRVDSGQADHDRFLESPSATTSYYRAWQPYNPTQLAAAYPARGAVLAISLSVSYGTSPAGH